ncbi:ribonuclease H-like domain-containing protein [Tanacetum coccineum]
MMAISSSSSSCSSDSEENKKFNNLNLELEKVVKERDELKLKIKKWKRPSKNLTKILNSQMSTHDKNGLGFGTQMDDLSNKSETDSENRLDEYDFRNKMIESKTTETNKTVGTTNEATIVKPKSINETFVSKSKINKDEVIIEDWTSDDEDDVCAVKTVSSVKPNVTQAVRSQTDKSGQTSQKQGIGFKKVHKIKACFVCKSTGHLIKDCDFYDQKSPKPRVKNVKYPHAKRTFNPSAVLTRAGLVNTDRSNVSTARSISTVRPVYTVRPVSTARPLASKIAQSNSVIRPNHPRLDIVRPKASNSPIKRSYFTQPVYRPKDLKPDVKTFGIKNMTTVGTRAVVSKGKVENVFKKDKWVWRPKMNYQDHVYKDNGSYMLKKFEYGNPEILLQDHAVVDSDCSSHMIGNKAYLSDYEDLNGGFVAFRSDPKRGEVHEEEISPTILEAAKTLSKVASQGVSKEKSTDKGKRYRRRARSMAKKIDTGLDAEEEINTGREEINTGIEEVSTGSTKVDSGTASKRGQREGKAPMVEEDIQATHKTKEQMRQEEAGLEEAIKLQAQLDEEVAKQIHLDKMIAKRMAEEEALSEQQKKRKAQVQFEAQFYTEEDWDVIKAKLEANAELTKDVLGKDLPEQDFAKRMAEMLKKLKFEEIKEEFDKLVQQIDTFVPINLEATKTKLKRYGEELQTKTSKKQRFDDKDVPAEGDKVAEVKEEEPVKRTGKRKKQKARKGINVDKSAQEDSKTDKEESVEAMNPTPLTTKSDNVKYGTNRPEDAYDRVLWSDLKTMFDPPLPEDAIWCLPLQQKMISWSKLGLESVEVISSSGHVFGSCGLLWKREGFGCWLTTTQQMVISSPFLIGIRTG